MENDLDAHMQEESDAESRGGDHRPCQDNGTEGHNSNIQGAPSGNSFPPVVQRVEDSNQAEPNDYGLNEGKEVGHNGSVADYGFGGSAGGGKDKNITK